MLLDPLSVAASFFCTSFPRRAAGAFLHKKSFFPHGIACTHTIGYSAAELAQSPCARFFSQQMRPLPNQLQQAILLGGVPGELMPGFDAAGTLLHAAAIDFPETYRYFDCTKLLF